MEETLQRSHDKGTMTGTLWHCDDIRLGHTISTFTDYVSVPASSQNDVIRLHFGMKGNYSFAYKQLNRSFHLLGGHHNMMYSQDFDIEIQNRTLQIETFGVQFPKAMFLDFTQNANDILKRFSDDIVNGKSVLLSEHWGVIDSPIQQAIQQIIHCKFAGDLKRLFLLSKSIELLVLCAEASNVAENRKDIFIKKSADKEKIIAVRDIINDRLSDPPGLSEIAKLVGLNEYKLKRGFKETFNNTIFGYLSEQRLNLAQQYLRDTEKTAAEIAFELGYATPQHFNNAFKKKFGITPFSVRNNP
jgi:AraC-like DNA-binding protein